MSVATRRGTPLSMIVVVAVLVVAAVVVAQNARDDDKPQVSMRVEFLPHHRELTGVVAISATIDNVPVTKPDESTRWSPWARSFPLGSTGGAVLHASHTWLGKLTCSVTPSDGRARVFQVIEGPGSVTCTLPPRPRK